MNKEKSLKMLADISNANGVSGFEDEVVAVLKGYSQELGTQRENSIRNLYVNRNGNNGGRPVLQLDAHSDEVGFMVQSIKPNGTLAFVTLGGWAANNIPAHKVRVRNAEGEYITGIVSSKPVHYMSEAEKKAASSISSMVIDVGASSAKEIHCDYKIKIGAPVIPDVTFSYDRKRDLMIGKAFDCRAGCAAVIDTLEELKNSAIDIDITATFTAQEEVGLRGAKVAVGNVRPDLAIAFEGAPADDTFGSPATAQSVLRKGPMLRHMDATMIANPRFQRFALDIAEKYQIPVQEAVRTGGGTNGGAVHLAQEGVPVIVISIPVRYIHTHYGIAAYQDYQNGVALAVEIIKSLNEETIRGF